MLKQGAKLILCLALGLVACGGAAGGSGEGGQTEPKAQFKAGFGMADVTPEGSVPLASYGDSRERMSTGMYSFLEARAVAIQDENGDLLLFITGAFLGHTTFNRFVIFCITAGISIAVIPILYPTFSAISKLGGDSWKD